MDLTNILPTSRGCQHLAMGISFSPTQNHLFQAASDLMAFKRRPRAAGISLTGTDLAPRSRIDFDPGFWLIGQAENAPGVGDHAQNQVVEAQTAFAYRGEEERESGLQSRETGGRVLSVLFCQGVRRMISCKDVDHSQVFPKSISVSRRCQVGAHFTSPGADGRRIFLGKEKVMRCDLASNF